VRVAIVGISGSGKTALARAVAGRLAAPYLELDSIYHQPGWTPLPDDEFRARVAVVTSSDDWVIDGNYGQVQPLILDRATDVLWLDYSRAVVMSRVIRRSARRAFVDRELWNGNRESMRNWVDAEHPIRWAWSNLQRKRDEYGVRFRAPEYAHLRVQRFQSPREASAWLAATH
jgi:adenylate kinase family enzyme